MPTMKKTSNSGLVWFGLVLFLPQVNRALAMKNSWFRHRFELNKTNFLARNYKYWHIDGRQISNGDDYMWVKDEFSVLYNT